MIYSTGRKCQIEIMSTITKRIYRISLGQETGRLLSLMVVTDKIRQHSNLHENYHRYVSFYLTDSAAIRP